MTPRYYFILLAAGIRGNRRKIILAEALKINYLAMLLFVFFRETSWRINQANVARHTYQLFSFIFDSGTQLPIALHAPYQGM